ncbi:hypothetical protein Hjap01_03512 [Haloarcula japonica]
MSTRLPLSACSTEEFVSEKRLLNESARAAEVGSPARVPVVSAVVLSSVYSVNRRFSCPVGGWTGSWRDSYHSRTTASSVSVRRQSGSCVVAQLSATSLLRAPFRVIYRTEPRRSATIWSARSKAACSKPECWGPVRSVSFIEYYSPRVSAHFTFAETISLADRYLGYSGYSTNSIQSGRVKQ